DRRERFEPIAGMTHVAAEIGKITLEELAIRGDVVDDEHYRPAGCGEPAGHRPPPPHEGATRNVRPTSSRARYHHPPPNVHSPAPRRRPHDGPRARRTRVSRIRSANSMWVKMTRT